MARHCNEIPPHDALDMKSPAEYLEAVSSGCTVPSHMC